MATIYRKTFPVPMPDGAEVVVRRGRTLACWSTQRGVVKTAELAPDGQRIMYEASVWYARYRDADGIERRVSTGCKDEQNARKFLADLLADLEKVKAGVLSPQQRKAALQVKQPLAEHHEAYLQHLAAQGRCLKHRRDTAMRLEKLAKVCRFRHLSDLSAGPAEAYLVDLAEKGVSARSRNAYRIAAVAFGNWCVRTHRLSHNPFTALPIANTKLDRRKRRRALSQDEVRRLIHAATLRPLADYGRKTQRTKDGGWTKAPLIYGKLAEAVARAHVALADSPKTIRKLQRLGQRNAMAYRIAVLTGLRRAELASLTVHDLHLDHDPPYLIVQPQHEKARRGAKIPLCPELVAALREYLRERPKRSEKLIGVPKLKAFDRDLAAAGIAKTDEAGRSVDFHALRHTFATLLARRNVNPRIAQQLLRHSSIELTMNTYTHLDLTDTAGAVVGLGV